MHHAIKAILGDVVFPFEIIIILVFPDAFEDMKSKMTKLPETKDKDSKEATAIAIRHKVLIIPIIESKNLNVERKYEFARFYIA